MKSSPLSLSYDAAIAKVPAISPQLSAETINPISETILLTHGRKTERVIALLHGYTNSPMQFRELGERFFKLGWNVVVPRMPYHGLTNRLTENLKHLTATKLADYANRVVDVAAGLGDSVTVMGLSAGGVLSGWLAHHRKEIDHAVIASPALGIAGYDPRVIRPLATAFTNLPNQFIWWGEPGDMGTRMLHAYPRMATRGLGAILKLGLDVQRRSATERPFAKRIAMVVNENDQAVHLETALKLADNWERNGVVVDRFRFLKEYGLDHDLIDTDHELANIEFVYPILMQLALRQ